MERRQRASQSHALTQIQFLFTSADPTTKFWLALPAKAFFLVILCLFFQKESCAKNEFDMHENELVGGTNFYMNGCARLRLFLAQRQKTTGKWSITESFRPSFSSSSHLHLNNSRTYAALGHDLSISWLIHLVIFCIRLPFFLQFIWNRDSLLGTWFTLLSSLSFIRMLSLRRIITTPQQFWFLQTTQQTEETLIQHTMQYQLGQRSEWFIPESC